MKKEGNAPLFLCYGATLRPQALQNLALGGSAFPQYVQNLETLGVVDSLGGTIG